MRKNRTILLFCILVFIVPALAWMALQCYETVYQELPVIGKTSGNKGHEADHQISDFSLLNQAGEQTSLAKWKHQIIVVDFFFTHCPVVCPQMTQNMKKIQEQYRKDADISLVSFSVDPERDSVDVLQKYALRFGIDPRKWTLLTGDKKTIYKLARNSFLLIATDGDGGPTDFIHSDQLVLIDKQQRIRGYYDGMSDGSVDKLLKDINKLKDED